MEPLCTAMHNPDPLLRMLCVEALGKIGDPAAIDTLRRALGDADTHRLRRGAQVAQADGCASRRQVRSSPPLRGAGVTGQG